MTSGAVPGFLPSVHGLRFANAFPPGPTVRPAGLDPRVLGIGDASAGLCGGIVLTARDLFEAGIAPPPDTTPPANGSPRFRALVRRQVDSLDWLRVPLRYFDLQAFRPEPPTRLAASLGREPARVEAVLREWPRIRREIGAGHPSVVGLVRASGGNPWHLVRHHQVLAYRWQAGAGSIVIGLYDPNHPGQDDVELRVTIDLAVGDRPWRDRIRLAQSTGEPVAGFFRQPYPGPRPASLAAWR